MLGYVLLYFAGKAFYDLAGKHGKHQWGFGILGVVSYFAGLFFGGTLIGFAVVLSGGEVTDDNETWYSLLAVPIGVFTCWITYVLLKRSWSKPREIDPRTLDGDLIQKQ